MATVNGLKREIIRRIKADEYFDEVYTIADRNSSGKFYLVGGKLYRTAIEVMYERNAAAELADWDFLCMKVEMYGRKPKDWRYLSPEIASNVDSEYPGEYSCRSKRMEKSSTRYNKLLKRYTNQVSCRLDLIDVNDSVEAGCFTPALTGYLDAVPMSIQAIAYDFESDTIIGDRGIWSVMRQVCFMNPTFNPVITPYRSHSQWIKYFDTKTNSLGFKWHDGKHLCYCSPEWGAGLWKGCKCGGL